MPECRCREVVGGAGQLWEVVGGVGKGGIIVRIGKDLSSDQAEDRLSTGALVKQLEFDGMRLHFKRLTGSGPDVGWVSPKLGNKSLLTKASAPELPADAINARAADTDGPFGGVLMGAVPGNATLLLALLHGRSANAEELSGLAKSIIAHLSVIDLQAQVIDSHLGQQITVLLPEAGGGSWLESAKPSYSFVQGLAATLKHAIGQQSLQPLVVVGGFSQGSVAACALPELAKEGVVASGFVSIAGFIDMRSIREAAEDKETACWGPLHVLYEHGIGDMVVPQMAPEVITRACKDLPDTARGVVVDSYIHNGDHRVGDGTVEVISEWLQDIVASSKV